VFTQQPVDLAAGTTMSVAVSVESAGGIVIAGDDATQVALSVDACGTTPLGTVTVSAGVAHFDLPAFYTVATGLQLHATADPGLSGDSAAFDVQANADLAFADGFESCRP